MVIRKFYIKTDNFGGAKKYLRRLFFLLYNIELKIYNTKS